MHLTKTTNINWLNPCRNTLFLLFFFASVLLLPATGFCEETQSREKSQDTTEKAAEVAVERVLEKAAKEEAKKHIQKARRPDEEKGPTTVYFMVFVLDIDAINDADQNFVANVYIQLRWRDRRLANPNGITQNRPLEEVWNPQIILANRQGLISRSLPDVVQVTPDGTVTYRQRVTGKLSQPMQLADFPMDKHTFSIHFASAGYSSDELNFLPDTSQYDPSIIGGSMADSLSLPDWKILGYEALALPYQPTKEIKAAGFAFRFEAGRHVEYYFWQLVLPLSVIVMMSWASFWIQREQPGIRIGVATSSILTMIAQRFVLASLLPRLPYMTRMDYFTVGCTLLVLCALLGVVATSYLSSINRDLMAKRFDLLARGFLPLIFIVLLSWFLFG